MKAAISKPASGAARSDFVKAHNPSAKLFRVFLNGSARTQTNRSGKRTRDDFESATGYRVRFEWNDGWISIFFEDVLNQRASWEFVVATSSVIASWSVQELAEACAEFMVDPNAASGRDNGD